MKTYTFWRSALTIIGVWLASAAFTAAVAQPGSGGPGPGTQPPDPTAVPLDGGASLLLAAGVGLGIKRLRERRLARK
jgi:hypothetical protein